MNDINEYNKEINNIVNLLNKLNIGIATDDNNNFISNLVLYDKDIKDFVLFLEKVNKKWLVI